MNNQRNSNRRDDEETNMKNNDAQESELSDSVFIVDPKGDKYLAESLNDNGVKFHSNGHTFWLGESGSGMAFAKELMISSRVACSVINDVQQP